MDGRIRPGVWIVAAAVLVAVAVVVRLALPGSERESRNEGGREPARVASLVRGKTASGATPAIRVLPLTAEPPSSSRALPAPVETHGSSVAQQEATPPTHPRLPPADSRLASDLRVLEEEAARHVGTRGVAAPAPPTAAGTAAASSASDEDPPRSAAADAVLVDYLVQQAYRGTEFPIGYPAEERTRADAQSRVSALTPELRLAMLRLALQAGQEPIAPRVDPFQIWEGSIH